MRSIDEFFADKCGINIHSSQTENGVLLWTMIPPYHQVVRQWTIQDPRCREIIREEFSISTYMNHIELDGKAWWCQDNTGIETNIYKSLFEAEIACMQAIYDAGQWENIKAFINESNSD